MGGDTGAVFVVGDHAEAVLSEFLQPGDRVRQAPHVHVLSPTTPPGQAQVSSAVPVTPQSSCTAWVSPSGTASMWEDATSEFPGENSPCPV